jgi:hypothetical protein
MNNFGKTLITAVVILGTAACSASSSAQSLKVAGHEPWVVHDKDSNASTKRSSSPYRLHPAKGGPEGRRAGGGRSRTRPFLGSLWP